MQSTSGAVVIGTTPVVTYTYNDMAGGTNNDRLTSMTYNDGTTNDSVYNYGIDNHISRLSAITSGSTILEGYQYIGLDTIVGQLREGNVTGSLLYTAGDTGSAGDEYTGLDQFGRVTALSWFNMAVSTPAIIDSVGYTFDQDSNVTAKTVSGGALTGTSASYKEEFAYDGENELTTFDRYDYSTSTSSYSTLEAATTQSFNLDEVGNASSVTTDTTTQSRTTNLDNELTGVGSLTLTYDNNGNTTTDDQGHTLVYNAWNELVKVKSSSGALIQSYSYDALGDRITITDPSGDSTLITNQYYSVSGQLLIAQVSCVTVAHYVWGNSYINELIVEDLPSGDTLARYWVEQDANWNVISVTNGSGTVEERYRYSAFGVATVTNASGGTESTPIGQTMLFQGMQFFSATNLYGTDWLFYSPTLMRWIMVDPTGYMAGDVNLYRTERDDPASSLDPTGLGPWRWLKDQGEAVLDTALEPVRVVGDGVRVGLFVVDEATEATTGYRLTYKSGEIPDFQSEGPKAILATPAGETPDYDAILLKAVPKAEEPIIALFGIGKIPAATRIVVNNAKPVATSAWLWYATNKGPVDNTLASLVDPGRTSYVRCPLAKPTVWNSIKGTHLFMKGRRYLAHLSLLLSQILECGCMAMGRNISPSM